MPQQIDPHTSETTTSSPAVAGDPIALARKEAEKIPDSELVAIRADLIGAGSTAMGALPAIERHRAAIVATFGGEGTDALAAVQPAAQAAMLAQGEYLAASDPDLEVDAKALRAKKELFETVAGASKKRAIVDKKQLTRLVGGQAYDDLVGDCLALVSWFDAHRDVISEHSKVTRDDLAAFRADAFRFVQRVAERDGVRAGTDPVAIARTRAFTYLVRVWDQVRKLVTFVRWHEGDADLIAPSFYAGRTRGGDAEPEVPATPNDIAPGLPGASPFARNP